VASARRSARRTAPSSTVFLRQNVRSNYCAPYATAMFLSLVGREMDRAEALRSFSVRRKGWSGATHEEMAQVVGCAVPGIRTRWRHLKAANVENLISHLKRSSSGRPVLVTARCELLRHGVADWHTFVVIEADDKSATLLDPLGRCPESLEHGNAVLRVIDGRLRTDASSSDAQWAIDLDNRVSAMRWTLPSSHDRKTQRAPASISLKSVFDLA
jgi:hypothetical protein